MRRNTTLFLAVIATAAVLTGCSSSSSSSSPASGGSASESGKITIGSDQANDHGTEDVTGKSSFELEADNGDEGFYFEPTVLTGSANQKITLEIANEGTAQHNFSITDQNVSVNIEPGSSEEVEVTFPASGTVEFCCSFHRALGMAGQLEVA
jgi:plastocyanin